LVANFNRPVGGGSLRTKAHGQRVDASIRRGAEHSETVRRLERELEGLRRQPDQPAAPAAPITVDELRGAGFVKYRGDWYEVAKVNRTTVAVKGGRDPVKVSGITDYRGPDGKKRDTSASAGAAPDAPEPTKDAGGRENLDRAEAGARAKTGRQQLDAVRERLAGGDEWARKIAKDPKLEVSADGHLVMFHNGRGDWRVARSLDGKSAANLLDNKQQAQAVMRALGELRTPDDNPVDWHNIGPNTEVTRNGRTESFTLAARRAINEARGGQYAEMQRQEDDSRERSSREQAAKVTRMARGGYTRTAKPVDLTAGDEIAYEYQPVHGGIGTLEGYSGKDPVTIRARITGEGRTTRDGDWRFPLADGATWQTIDGRTGRVILDADMRRASGPAIANRYGNAQVFIRPKRAGGLDPSAPPGSRYEVRQMRRPNGYYGPVVVRIEPDGHETAINYSAGTKTEADKLARQMRQELRGSK
jgi:hypothetical protein